MTMTIGDRIEEFLVEKNMTRKDLIEKSGINKGTLSKYIRNQNIPSLENIIKISEALNIPPSELCCFKDKDHCSFYKKNKFETMEIDSSIFCVSNNSDKVVVLRKKTNNLSIVIRESEKYIRSGEKIRVTLNMSGMLIKELAEKIGVEANQVSTYVHNKRNPSLLTIESFADALQVSPSWLAGFIDVDTRNTFVMADNPEETIYLHPSQYIIKEIKDNGDTIILEKIKKE